MAEQHHPSHLHEAVKTNLVTKFQPFSLTLANGANLTGILYLPSESSATSNSSAKPLVVGIHGATCSAYTWDVSPTYTASNPSDMFGVPFVAFNRPNFLDSSGWVIDRAATEVQFDQPAAGDGYFAEEARWFHEYIFPALWTKFAVPNGCTSIVTTSHSMSVPPTVIAAGLYASAATRDQPAYTWAGIIISGFGIEATEIRTQKSAALATNELTPDDIPLGQDVTVHTPPFKTTDKQDLMLGPSELTESSLRALISKQTTPFLQGEIMDMIGVWPNKATAYKALVRLPVLYGLGSHDWIWRAERRTVDEFLKGFTASERVEGAVVQGAGHAIELSPVNAGWWARMFGWAMEVAGGLEVQKRGIPVYP
ncbi:hypothetical protein VHEMI05581 [[Torrubiella] hemipterigena]|uniref:AB hydrolase-1 domain-containing protein n=1 Tax=[Torrubiella] hemipterigena TaxID=1531966 RepID=A0A0A1SYD4_9HYPO|nr:hypothetical protein VHEMI05581 [[Torrubiella] hemipterigena]